MTNTAPEQWTKRPPARVVMSVRIRPALRDELDGYVKQLQAQGWDGLEKHHVVEHLMARLLTEDGRAEITRELAGGAPK